MPHKVADIDTESQRAKVRDRLTGSAVIALQLSITVVIRSETETEAEKLAAESVRDVLNYKFTLRQQGEQERVEVGGLREVALNQCLHINLYVYIILYITVYMNIYNLYLNSQFTIGAHYFTFPFVTFLPAGYVAVLQPFCSSACAFTISFTSSLIYFISCLLTTLAN